MKFEFTITKAQVDKAYQEVLKEVAATTTIKGFRQGKAPVKMVEEKVGKNELEKHALEHLLPAEFNKVIKEKGIKIISYPNITPKTAGKDGSWIFEAEVATKPQINLEGYQESLKGILSKDAIWTPDKNVDKDVKDQPDEDKQLAKIFDTVLEKVKVEIPELLIRREADRMLSRLLDQLNKLGLTIDAYLESIGKNKESIRAEYEQTATTNLQLEFILEEIASVEKIEVTDKEVDVFISAIPEMKLKDKTASNDERANIAYILKRRKTMEHLRKLAA